MVQISNRRSSDGEQRLKRRAEVRRREILRAAAKVFREFGYAKAGMREIATQADLSSGNLYHYFSGKDEILFFCQSSWLDHMLGRLDAVRPMNSVKAALEQILDQHVSSLLQDWEGSIAHLEVEGLPEPLRKKLVAKRDAYERGLRELVQRGMEAGEFHAGDPTLVTRAILGALNWTARWFKPDGKQSANEVAAQFRVYLLRGLLKEEARG